MKITGIIPARYGSSRFPGKPLAMLEGRPMLFRVFEQASRSRLLTELFVATESPLIEEACRQEGIPVLMTSPDHENPTSRLCEAAKKTDASLHVMIGGDEPLLTGSDIDSTVRRALKLIQSPEPLFPGREELAAGVRSGLFVVNAMAPVSSPAEAMDTTNIKVVCGDFGVGLYTSRFPIPYPKGSLNFTYRKFASIGVYTREALRFFEETPRGILETIEECDLLRFMEKGVPVFFVDTGHPSLSVDTRKDLAEVGRMLTFG